MTLLTKNIALMKTEVQEHIAADAVVGRKYWVPSDNAVGGTGCFIGCLTHSSDPLILEERFGFPVILTRVVEDIFERLPSVDQPRFFGDIPAAIAVDGKDLTRVVWAFFAEELRALPVVSEDVQAAIDPVISGMDVLAAGGRWSSQDARNATRAEASAADAADAARNADYAARNADYAAYYAADYAAYAAEAATRAEASAAYSAAYATRAAAEAAGYADAAAEAAGSAAGARQRQAARILRLIAEAPVVQGEEAL